MYTVHYGTMNIIVHCTLCTMQYSVYYCTLLGTRQCTLLYTIQYQKAVDYMLQGYITLDGAPFNIYSVKI